MTAVGLYYDPLFLEHDTLGHPESARRVEACLALLEESGVAGRLERPACRDATVEELARIHRREHIEIVRLVSEQGPVYATPDTIANRGTYAAAVRAAGACIGATEAVARGELESAFCLTRPPGHHAVAGRIMGFCFFNSVAIAAAHARAALGIDRVAIVDIDIHHGNGTQDAFYEDASVLYVSTHQYGPTAQGQPFYPGSGHWREAGAVEGIGATLNLSLPHGCADTEYGLLFDEVVLPKLRAFRPGLILVSAGYDAHYADPIDGATQRQSCAGYAALVEKIRAAALELCDGRVVAALEGGYDLAALSWCVRNSIEALLGESITADPLGPAPVGDAPNLGVLIASVKDLHGL